MQPKFKYKYYYSYTCIDVLSKTNTQFSKYVPKTQTKIRYLYPFKPRKYCLNGIIHTFNIYTDSENS